jgi:phospho-N-acetylmuramoyl-pentapeptide-transferase
MIATIVSGGLSFLFVLLFTAVGTNLFKSRNIGQSIQEELTHHDHKSGTPTMGGLFIVAGTYFGFLVAHINFWTIGQGFKVEIDYINSEVFNLLLFGTLMSLVGFLDDYLKVKKGRNLGLSAKNKLTLQLIVASFVSYYFYSSDYSTTLYLFSGFGLNIGILKWLIVVIFIVGFSNAVNLTDGLDGLVAGSSTVSFGGILVITFWIFRHPEYYFDFMDNSFLSLDLSILVSSIAGSCLGFLWWNTTPAKIIMGDVGSLFLGAMFPIILFSIGADMLIFFICMLYVIEALSVILQVGSFKLRGTRIFKMAPLHHHFEMNNWAETTIIVRFWIVNGIFVVIALGLFYGDWVLFGN